MSVREDDQLVAGDLRIARRRATPDVLVLEWLGRSQDRDPERTIGAFLRDAVREVGEAGASLEMHFERLEHFNSSTVTALIQLIRFARGLQVPVVIVFDEGCKWQRLSFEALRVFQVPDGLLELRSAGS